MKKGNCFIILILLTMMFNTNTVGQVLSSNYLNNREPLFKKPYIELPLGSVKPKGWLLEMLIRQKDGLTGNLDKFYSKVMGPRNGWLGGDGDQWERGPYWLDGLLPLAYILDDENLKAKLKPWIEWTINSQQENGYFGPSVDYQPEKGLQRNNSHDWWPKMVMLKVLQQYYSATGDKRVLDLMTGYFHYQLKTLPLQPLGYWTDWAEYRVCDNLQAVYWLYNITGDSSLLELSELLYSQGFNYTNMFFGRDLLSKINSFHGVNLAQGFKEPVIYYQQHHDQKFIYAVKLGFSDLLKYHGQPQGMYSCDESLHGNIPTQGTELCSIVELMFSLEKMMEISGDVEFADHLEKIAFNALPAQVSNDFMSRQYFQQPNQVMITRNLHNFDINHGETELVFGLLTGYPCCTSNFHQGWPKFIQNLWYASEDKGLAAIVYSPSEVEALVSERVKVKITEETFYPMSNEINFTLRIQDQKVDNVEFPFHLRIPGWCKNAKIEINSIAWANPKGGQIIKINRVWKSGDKVKVTLPMNITTSTWCENSVAVERGPLVYALKIGERWEKKEVFDDPARFGEWYFEVFPTSKWNYGIMDFNPDKMEESFRLVEYADKQKLNFPWNQENAPVEIKVKAKEIKSWKLYNEMAGPLPFSRTVYGTNTNDITEEEVTLIPYGCTTLRISEFPVIKEYPKR